ncbi:MAG: hypothetical protein ABIR06_06845, partial [Cyclobacteriaceae bacterium]
MPKQKSHHYFLQLISLSLYIAIGYGIQRYETFPLLIFCFLAFSIYAWVCSLKEETNFWTF